MRGRFTVQATLIKSSRWPTILLTGATGLLGRFVLARLLQARCEVAVLIRSTAQRSARQRLEEALVPCEQASWLPRPRLLTGDLTNSQLGLADADLKWLQSRRLCIVHCAASIRFQREQATDEPYRTNVLGTQNILQFCAQRQIEAFHYVSTAYVGSRTEHLPVREILPPAEALGGNDYERSKIITEQLVANCTHIGAKTIHRPSIIVGDSQTGFTSTYHGFYAPLNIGYQLAKQYGFAPQAGSWFRQQLGLEPHDTKNLVPVDWVSAAIAQVVLTGPSTARGPDEALILHWTNPRPVSCSRLQEAIGAAIERAAAQRVAAQPVSKGGRAVATPPNADDFRQAMQVYESYFSSDPTFDDSEARTVCPQLPCPVIDNAVLQRLSDYAIAHKFGWPKPQSGQIPYDTLIGLLRSFQPLQGSGGRSFLLCLLGPGAPETLGFAQSAGEWFAVDDCKAVQSAKSVCRPAIVMTATISTLADWFAGKTRLALAFEQGCCIMEGELPENGLALLEDWMAALRSMTPPPQGNA